MAGNSRKIGVVVMAISALLLAVAAFMAIFPNLLPHDATSTKTVKIGAPFALTDQNGQPYSSAKLNGKPFAIFFGYTHCPDECPTTLTDLTQAMAQLGPDAEKLQVLFVTFDPSRDTAPVMHQYMSAFDPRIVALTGSEAAISALAKSYYVYWKKVPGKGDDYDFDHSSAVYLIDAHGAYSGQMSMEETRASMVSKLKKLIASAG
ncbi:MAG: SCO family protein [Hyphomicrobiales bacterium]|nr:SCO family protein [Hyphomicrobiales bacterium]MDE2113492.1 SCO family protein [Hyphomicrobiales bacterium]